MAVNEAKLKKLMASENIADGMDEEEVSNIGQDALKDYQIDDDSLSEWRTQNEEAMKLAKQVAGAKNFPWENAANIKYPLITVASQQFGARAYPEIIQGENVAKFRVVGSDPLELKAKRAERMQAYMNWQLTCDMREWESDTDRLIHTLPIIGCLFRKTYFDGLLQRPKSIYHTPSDVVINYKARSLDTARRISHIIRRYRNDVHERVVRGIWSDVDLGDPPTEDGDTDSYYEFVEQHRFIDLDGDGYKEPYIVTFKKDDGKVVRIVARYDKSGLHINTLKNKVERIEPVRCFTRYSFLPNPDGGIYDIGFGRLLTPINEAINTVLNELLDAGALANAGGGFLGSGVRMKAGTILRRLGEWVKVPFVGQKLRDNMVPNPAGEPSQVLFLLLGTLIEAGKDISSVKDVLTGEKPGENVSATTVLSLIEQGMKVFVGIYKRIYRSLGEELNLLYGIDCRYVDIDQYKMVLDDKMMIKEGNYDFRNDFTYSDYDIKPVADPNMALDVLRLARVQAGMQISGRPGVDEEALTKNYFDAIKLNPDIYYIPPDDERRKPQPDPQLEMQYLQMDIMKKKDDREAVESQIKNVKTMADAMLSIARAEKEEVGPQLDEYKTYAQELGVIVKLKQDELRQKQSEEKNVGTNTGTTGTLEE